MIVNDMIESIPQQLKLEIATEVAERRAMELQIRSIKLLADTRAFAAWIKQVGLSKKNPGGEPG
jgi:hypothetical protein